MTRLPAPRRLFGPDETGTATIEFVILFPVFLSLLLMAVELSIVTARATMLERGTDLVVRDIRLNTGNVPSYETIRDRICQRSLIIPNCAAQLRVEMQSLPANQWSAIDTRPRCINRAEPVDPNDGFRPGLENQLMILRVCALFDPVFPTSGLGYRIQNPDGDYAIRSTSAFVNEPQA